MTESHELAGAPLAWLWLFRLTAIAVVPAVFRGLARRGSGGGDERGFRIQRLPQLSIVASLVLAAIGFEAIELRLGSGEPLFGREGFESLGAGLAILTLAVVLPSAVAAAIAWVGVGLTAFGVVFVVWGVYSLSRSFSTDAELVRGHAFVSSGPFRLVMHPMYCGFAFALVGSALASLSAPSLLLTLFATIPLLLARARHEEALLRAAFPTEYRELEQGARGRRMVPWFIPIGI